MGAKFGEGVGISRHRNGLGLAGGAALGVADGEIAGALGGEAIEARGYGGESELAGTAGAGLEGAEGDRGARERLQADERARKRVAGKLVEQDAGDGPGMGGAREQE